MCVHERGRGADGSADGGAKGGARAVVGGVGGSARAAIRELSGETKLQLGVLVGCSMLVQMAIGVIVPVLPMYAASIGLSASDVGLLIALPSLAKLLLNLPVDYAVDTYGRKAPLVIGMLFDGLGSLATATARSVGAMAPARLLVGAGSAGATIAEQAYLMDVVSQYPQHQGLLLGTAQALGMLAFAAGPALGGILAEGTGSATLPFVLIGTVLIGTAPIYAWLLPETRPQQRTLRAATPPPRTGVTPTAAGGNARLVQRLRGTAAATRRAAAETAASFAALLTDRRQQSLLWLRFGLVAGWSVWLTIVPLAASAAWGATMGELGKLFSLLTVLGFAAAPIGGLLADRFQPSRVAAISSAASALAVGMLAFTRSQRGYIACLALWDVAESVLTAALTAHAAEVTSAEQRGAMNSLANQVQDLTFVVLPVLLGKAAMATSYSVALMLCAGLMIGASVAFGVSSLGAQSESHGAS